MLPCSSMPASIVSSSSDSEGYLNVLRKRCAAAVSASLSFSMPSSVCCVKLSTSFGETT